MYGALAPAALTQEEELKEAVHAGAAAAIHEAGADQDRQRRRRRQRLGILCGATLGIAGAVAISRVAAARSRPQAATMATLDAAGSTEADNDDRGPASDDTTRRTGGDPTYKQTVCTDPEAGPVIMGYDLVAYHELQDGAAAVKGSANNKVLWGEDGELQYEYHFSTPENRDRFVATPRRYVPAWGGFCAYGIAAESFWNAANLGPRGNPNVWKVIEGRLFIFMYDLPKQMFMEGNTQQFIADGNRRWRAWASVSSAEDETAIESDAAKPVSELQAPSTLYNTYCFWHEELTGMENATVKKEDWGPSLR